MALGTGEREGGAGPQVGYPPVVPEDLEGFGAPGDFGAPGPRRSPAPFGTSESPESPDPPDPPDSSEAPEELPEAPKGPLVAPEELARAPKGSPDVPGPGLSPSTPAFVIALPIPCSRWFSATPQPSKFRLA